MHVTAWIGLALGVVMTVGTKIQPPPVLLDLGPLSPTPAPTPKHADKKRLITTITVQNNAEGESVVSFEASDVALEGDGKFRPLASKNYSFAEEKIKPGVKEMREKILIKIRELERDLLKYAEAAGPPKERLPLLGGSQSDPEKR